MSRTRPPLPARAATYLLWVNAVIAALVAVVALGVMMFHLWPRQSGWWLVAWVLVSPPAGYWAIRWREERGLLR
jgi:hypothetical protein